jgi:hypothetical protein
MEKIEEFFSRWGTSIEKQAADMYGQVPKDKRRKTDLLRALPALGATVGGAAALMKFRGKPDMLKKILLSSGAGATTGWLPLVYRDAYRTIKARQAKRKK